MTAGKRFELWRQDDNGNHFLVGAYDYLPEAEQRLAELSRCLHKQTYWINAKSLKGATNGQTILDHS